MAMSKSILEAKVLQDEAAAYAWVEARIWPDGPVCPHCGGVIEFQKWAAKAPALVSISATSVASNSASRSGPFLKIVMFQCGFGCKLCICFAPRKRALVQTMLIRLVDISLISALVVPRAAYPACPE
jgi:Transposase zinc-ribbon domain